MPFMPCADSVHDWRFWSKKRAEWRGYSRAHELHANPLAPLSSLQSALPEHSVPARGEGFGVQQSPWPGVSFRVKGMVGDGWGQALILSIPHLLAACGVA